jgi:hypothetical protein
LQNCLQKGNEFALSDIGKETAIAHSAGADLEMFRKFKEDKIEAEKLNVGLMEFVEARRMGTL